MHVAVYARISRDQEGRAENVATQESHGRAYATERWPDTPCVTYSDNDLSSSNGDRRPGYEDLLAAVRRGEVTQVVCAEQSRLTRQPAEWEDLIVTLGRAGMGEVHTYRKGVVSLGSKPVGRIMAAVDAEESERVKARVIEKHAALAAAGRPRGGVEYGFRPGRNEAGEATLDVVAAEATVVRWIAEQLLAGWTLTAVADDLNRRGVPTLRGARWAQTGISRMLRKPSLAGMRSAHVRGTWEPILDVTVWRQVGQLLDSRVATKRRARRRFLLTGGIARCGRVECRGPMGAQQRTQARSKVSAVYRCQPARLGGCSRTYIGADALEHHVADALFDELERHPEFFAALAADDDDTERGRIGRALDEIDVQRADLGRMWAARDIDATGWAAAAAELDRQTGDAHRQLGALPAPAVDVDPAEVRGSWESMTLDEKRSLVDMFITSVTVGPAKPGTRRFDPTRVTIDWRTV